MLYANTTGASAACNVTGKRSQLLLASVIAWLILLSGNTIARDLALSPDSAQIAWDKINAGAVVIDVRTADEFASGHLQQAMNIPFQQIVTELAQPDRAKNISKDTPIVLYCRSGKRSSVAMKALVNAGYTQVYNGGGYQDLITATK